MHFGPARSSVLGQPFTLHLEALETRSMLSISPLDDAAFWLVDMFPPSDTEVVDSEVNGGSSGVDQPLPAIPFDDSVEGLKNCPGVEPGLCLPGDADGNGSVNFLDFLLLNESFGKEGSTWQDGDFDGDGIVAFGDFLILAAHFGQVA